MKKGIMFILGLIMSISLTACAEDATLMVQVPNFDSIEAYETWIETLDWEVELNFIAEDGEILNRTEAVSREIKSVGLTEINAEINELVLMMTTFAFDFSIERITPAQLAKIENASIVNYQEIHIGAEEGMSLHFEFNRPIENFTFISVDFVDNDGYRYVKTGILTEVGALGPNHSLILTHYMGAGTTAISGFTFTNPDGVDVCYAFQESQRDGSIYAIPFDWSHENEFYVNDSETSTINKESGDTVLAPPTALIPPVTPSQNATYHIVIAGETLTSIARLHGTTATALQQMNNMGMTTDITVGQRLSLIESSATNPSSRPEELLLKITNGNTPGSIIVQSNQNLTNISINSIYTESVDNELGRYWHVRGVLRELGNLNVNSELLINDFLFTGSSFFAEALIFNDENGNTRYFAFNQNQAYPAHGGMYIIREFIPGMEQSE